MAEIVLIGPNFNGVARKSIIFTGVGMNGKYRLPPNCFFRVKYVGDGCLVCQGLDEDVSLGEYIFDEADVKKLKMQTLRFNPEE